MSERNALGDRAASPSYANLAKGGAFARYYADIHLVLRWSHDGREAKSFLSEYRSRKGWGEDWSASLNGYSQYGRPGLTYWMRSLRGLSFRVLPRGCIFSLVGPAIFVEKRQITFPSCCACWQSSIAVHSRHVLMHRCQLRCIRWALSNTLRSLLFL